MKFLFTEIFKLKFLKISEMNFSKIFRKHRGSMVYRCMNFNFNLSLLQLSQVMYWLLVHTLPHASPVLVDWSTRWRSRLLRSRLLGSHNSSDIKPGGSWRKNSTVERACSFSAHGATVSIETVHVFLNPYQTSPTTSSQMNNDSVCQWSLITGLFWWGCSRIS